MSTNDNETPVTEDAVADLATAKAEAQDTNSEAEVSEPEAQSDPTPEVKEEAQAEPETTLTTPQEPDHDKDWYKKAYEESTKEALRLKALSEQVPEPPKVEIPEGTLTPDQLYIKQKQDEEIANAFADVTKNYSQVKDPEEYKKFTSMANTFGKTILDAEGRLATPKELYSKTVIALGWTADDSKEQLGAALKDSAGSPRVSSGVGQSTTSKVTDEMIIANRKMYPDKSDSEIREELEPHIQ